MGVPLEQFEDNVLVRNNLTAPISDLPCYEIAAIFCSTGVSLGLTDIEHWLDILDFLVHHAIIWRSFEAGEGSARRYENFERM